MAGEQSVHGAAAVPLIFKGKDLYMGSVQKIVHDGEILIHEAENLESEIGSERNTDVNTVVKNYIRQGEQITRASIKKSVEWGEKVWEKSKDLKEITL